MKTFLIAFIIGLPLICTAQDLRIKRLGTNVVIASTSLVFTARLEVSDGPDDEFGASWSFVEDQFSACPEPKSFIAPILDSSRIYRVRLLDNGIVPTPYDLRAYKDSLGSQVYLDWPLVFQCNDDPVDSFSVYRKDNGTDWKLIGSATGSNPHWSDDGLAIGGYAYKVKARVGTNESWFSDEAYVSFP